MSAELTGESEPTDTEPARTGGFRATIEVSTDRGGPRYGEFSEQVRTLMDHVRLACPAPELTDELIDDLRAINDKLTAARIDEWHSPAGTRIDLPSRGNITLPPYQVDEVGDDGVFATVVFRDFHLGGNNAAHGGHVAVAFDDLGGYASAMASRGVCRTANLTVQYRSITPLNTELSCHTWAEKIDGRKVFVRGELREGERLCAEMDGLFITLKPGQQ